MIPQFVDAALTGQPLNVHGDGTQSRDFTYVDTVTGVLTDAIVRRVTSDEPVNLAFGTRVTLLDVIAQLEAIVGRSRRAQPRQQPGWRRATQPGRQLAAAWRCFRTCSRSRSSTVSGRRSNGCRSTKA